MAGDDSLLNTEGTATPAAGSRRIVSKIGGVISLASAFALVGLAVFRNSGNDAPGAHSRKMMEQVTRKKGMGGMVGDHYLCSDAVSLGLQDSWYYSWIGFPSGTDKTKCKGKFVAREFAPMVHKATSGEKMLAALQDSEQDLKKQWTDSNIRFLLGYNEPDFAPDHPASITPKGGAELWPNVQKIANVFNPPLTIVSPSPASGAFDNTGRSWWLDQFFGNLTEMGIAPAIEIIGMHDYTGNATLMMQRIEGAYEIYGKQIWLTEYAIIVKGQCKKISPDEKRHEDYMRETIPLLEKSPAVFRYAWFASRQTPNDCAGSSGLLPWNTSATALTPLGQIYKDLEVADGDASIVV